jgi:glycyl-tRNA synthetase
MPKSETEIDVEKLSEILKRRFFYDQSFSIYYGSPAGFFDLGPIGCAIQNNLVNEWRKFFVIKLPRPTAGLTSAPSG